MTTGTVFSLSSEALLRLFECPVCFDIITPPIGQCSNGHIVCNQCRDGIVHCPLCRQVMIGTIRALCMEKLAAEIGANFPCDTCDEKYSLSELVNHKLTHQSDAITPQQPSSPMVTNTSVNQSTNDLPQAIPAEVRAMVQEIIIQALNGHLQRGTAAAEAFVSRRADSPRQYLRRMTRVLMHAGIDINSRSTLFDMIGLYQ